MTTVSFICVMCGKIVKWYLFPRDLEHWNQLRHRDSVAGQHWLLQKKSLKIVHLLLRFKEDNLASCARAFQLRLRYLENYSNYNELL